MVNGYDNGCPAHINHLTPCNSKISKNKILCFLSSHECMLNETGHFLCFNLSAVDIPRNLWKH